MVTTRVILLSNDVVPGMAAPVAAPGLRVFGLAEGLRRHGFEVEIVVPFGASDRQWRSREPQPRASGVHVLKPRQVTEFLETRGQDVLVITNSNQLEKVEHAPNPIVLDLFAPKLLEMIYSQEIFDPEPIQRLLARKLEAIRRADGFIINGEKKVPYFLAFMVQAGIDVRTARIAQVPMAVPWLGVESPERSGELRVGLAGYVQKWSLQGEWLSALLEYVESGAFELEVTMPAHWGQVSDVDHGDELAAVLGAGVTVNGALSFAKFKDMLNRLDVVVDLFDDTLERRLAMVTRTVVALSSGTPVIHPPFTEVAPLISEYGAGWLVESSDHEGLREVLDSIRANPREVEQHALGARRLWEDRFAPAVAVQELADLVSALG